jgi:hypothetical protein
MVENLKPGDLVITLSGSASPIQWIGQRCIDCRRHPKPEKVWPVRISARAFNENQPTRDLYLSPDHAVFIDNILVPIKYLVNNKTITQMPTNEVVYFHIELSNHCVILAEDLPCESYLEIGNRDSFTNSGTVTRLFLDFEASDLAGMWEARACAPIVVTGQQLEAVRLRLRERAKLLAEQQVEQSNGNDTQAA